MWNSRQKDSHMRERSNHQLNRVRTRFDQNISEAETSEDESHDKWTKSRKISQSPRQQRQREITQQRYQKTEEKLVNNSLTISLENFDDHIKKNIEIESHSNKSKPFNHYQQSSSDIEDQVTDIIEEIQYLNFQSLSFAQLKQKFIQYCGLHVNFYGYFPEPRDKVGDELIKNGFFHVKWSEAFLKSHEVKPQSLIQNYFNHFSKNIQKGKDNFYNVFNSKQREEKENFDIVYKRYRNCSQEKTQSTTRMDCMILYQQTKYKMKADNIEQSLAKTAKRSIEEWRVKTAEQELKINDNPNLDSMFEDEQKVIEKWSNKEQLQQQRKQAVEKFEKERARERSPSSNRFRMMHQCQEVQRRLQVQMACVFLRLDKFYFLNDLQIVKIQETIFSSNQQIVVVKAYTIELCRMSGMLKLEPKLKNLIAVYKFCTLSELIRLELTYGAFDGVIVYPECFNIEKYLANNKKELSLLNLDYLKQVKDQLPVSPLVEDDGNAIHY